MSDAINSWLKLSNYWIGTFFVIGIYISNTLLSDRNVVILSCDGLPSNKFTVEKAGIASVSFWKKDMQIPLRTSAIHPFRNLRYLSVRRDE